MTAPLERTDESAWSFETRQVHAGTRPDPTTGARAVPIYQTTSYVFQSTEHAAALFDLEAVGHVYTRISNPTTEALELRIASLEGGVGALAVASGQAASAYSLLNLADAGDHIVSSSSLYGGTHALFEHRLSRLGIDDDVRRRPRRPRCVARRRSGRTRRRATGSRSATRAATCSTSRASPPSRTTRASRSSSTTRSRARTCCVRSSGAPTWWSTRRPSSSAVTARRSAA